MSATPQSISPRAFGYDAEGSAAANLPGPAQPEARRARPIARADYRPSRAGRRAHATAHGLGWFSIALGLAELLAPHAVARFVGMQGSEGLLRVYGLREIGTGVGLLTARDPTPWMWGRVAGDALDLATLGASTGSDNPHRAGAMVGLAAVAGVTVADLATAQTLHSESERRRQPQFDYSDRSGFPRPPSDMRGAASDFEMPRDMQVPEALRP